jgi:hypothetical protein
LGLVLFIIMRRWFTNLAHKIKKRDSFGLIIGLAHRFTIRPPFGRFR